MNESAAAREIAVSRLNEERRTTMQRLAGLTDEFQGIVDASLDTNADDEHDPEGTTIAYERSQVASLVNVTKGHLTEIDEALARVERGTYGRCADCGEMIAEARLEARPAAARCINCA